MPEQREQGETRQNILGLLRRHHTMTAIELGDALGIGAVGIRQHLALLERDALVQVSGLRRSVGRPSHLYSLTPEAEAQFPKDYSSVALDALQFIESQLGAESVDVFFARRRSQAAATLRPKLVSDSLVNNVETLSVLLREQGFMTEYGAGDEEFTIVHYNCPLDCVARAYPQACVQEQLLYQDVLGVPVELVSTLASGATCCRYRIQANGS